MHLEQRFLTFLVPDPLIRFPKLWRPTAINLISLRPFTIHYSIIATIMMHLLHTMHNNMFLETSIKSPFVTFYEFLILYKSVKWNFENEVFCRRALCIIFIF